MGQKKTPPGETGKPNDAARPPLEAAELAAEAIAPVASDEEVETAPEAQSGAARDREQTQITVSRGLAEWLSSNTISLALTSYQTGQLMLVGSLPMGRLSLHERNFVRAMGLCASPQRLYLSTIAQVWRLENVLRPGQKANQHFDRLYLPRNAQTTGDIDIHEMAVDTKGQVVFVCTKYSCLGTFSQTDSFKPLWKPSFISKLAPEDRCHLNGLATHQGRPKYVTAVSRSDVVDGWRERRAEGGVMIDIDEDRIVTSELSMPHSPRLANGALWVLNSGRGNLCRVDPKTGRRETVAFCPGFMRGLSFWRHYAAVGTSLPRDGTFKGLELDDAIKARDSEPRCGVFIIDTRTADILHWLRFEGRVRELFDVAFIPGVLTPMCVGLASPEMRTLVTYESEATTTTSLPLGESLDG